MAHPDLHRIFSFSLIVDREPDRMHDFAVAMICYGLDYCAPGASQGMQDARRSLHNIAMHLICNGRRMTPCSAI